MSININFDEVNNACDELDVKKQQIQSSIDERHVELNNVITNITKESEIEIISENQNDLDEIGNDLDNLLNSL